MTSIEPRTEGRTSQGLPTDRSRRQVFSDYLALTKPRIIELLLVTTFPVMFLAERGVDRWDDVALADLRSWLASMDEAGAAKSTIA